MGRDHLRLGADLAPGHRGRRTGDRCRARTIGAEPIGRGVGVALLDRDVLGRNAELARQDLGERRRVSLALADRAEARDDTARRMDPDFAGIEHAETKNVAVLDRPGADDLGKEADPDAHQLAGLAATERFAFPAICGNGYKRRILFTGSLKNTMIPSPENWSSVPSNWLTSGPNAP